MTNFKGQVQQQSEKNVNIRLLTRGNSNSNNNNNNNNNKGESIPEQSVRQQQQQHHLKEAIMKNTVLDQCNLFVKHLPSDMDNASLNKLFQRFGTIVSSRIMTNEKGESLGFGFVRFSTNSEAQSAIREMNGHKIKNKSLLCKFSYKKPLSGEFTEKGRRYRNHSHSTGTKFEIPNSILYVRNIPPSFGDEELKELFKNFGNILEASLLNNNNNNNSYSNSINSNDAPGKAGFVKFERLEDATKALIAMNQYSTQIDGVTYRLVVKYSEQRAHVVIPRQQQNDIHPVMSSYIPTQNISIPPQYTQHLPPTDAYYSTIIYSSNPSFVPTDALPLPMVTAQKAPKEESFGTTRTPTDENPSSEAINTTEKSEQPDTITKSNNTGGLSEETIDPALDTSVNYYSTMTASYGYPLTFPNYYYAAFIPPPEYNAAHALKFGYFPQGFEHHIEIDNRIRTSNIIRNRQKYNNEDPNLFVFHLPSDMHDDTLRTLFEKFGEIESVKVIYDPVTNASKGYGFVKYKHMSDAVKAIAEMNGFKIGRKHLKVSFKISGKRHIHKGRKLANLDITSNEMEISVGGDRIPSTELTNADQNKETITETGAASSIE
jgi:RNA recognition motif-containing protein